MKEDLFGTRKTRMHCLFFMENRVWFLKESPILQREILGICGAQLCSGFSYHKACPFVSTLRDYLTDQKMALGRVYPNHTGLKD